MAVTNLTGYTWVGQDMIFPTSSNTFSINFTSNSVSYSAFEIDTNGPYGRSQLKYNNTLAYETGTEDPWEGGMWTNSAYQTIVITGGTDVTNTTLISWLEGQGTLTAPAADPDMIVDLSTLGLGLGTTYTIYATAFAEGYVESPASNTVSYTVPFDGSIILDKFKYPDYYGMSTNSSLQEIIQLSGYSIINNITNGTLDAQLLPTTEGKAQVLIIGNDGYIPPTSVTVSNAVVENYNQYTGLLNISNITDDVTITGSCATEHNYQVTITISETDIDYKSSCNIIDGNTTIVHTTTNESIGTRTVVCKTGYLIVTYSAWGGADGSFSATGDISLNGTTGYSTDFIVTGNGTISGSIYYVD